MRGRSFGKVVLLGGGNTELELLQRAFNGCGRTACTVFHNARAALHYLETVRVDVMVVDCLSIDMEIFNFLEQARKTPGSGACRIVVTGPSGYAENVRLALLSNGADYYMIKPYKANALFVSIESLAPGHRRPQKTLPFCTCCGGSARRKRTLDIGIWPAACSIGCGNGPDRPS